MFVSFFNVIGNVQVPGEPHQSSRCPEHADQAQTYYCNTCRTGACHYCVLSDGRHQNHDVHLLAIVCKLQKVSTLSLPVVALVDASG